MKKQIIVFVFAIAIVSLLSFSTQKFDLKASISRGKEVYVAQCASCHQEQGEGIDEVFPPLAKSDYLMADKKRSIEQILYGATGEMKVNGKVYNGVMPAFDLTDEQASDVLNFIRNSWGNKGEAVLPSEIHGLRK
jgi:mono/diheme cytochrome c family protein